jgi:hypothetical protein
MPRQGEAGWEDVQERQHSTQAPMRHSGVRNAWPALIATAIGFGIGVVVAWLSGAL